MKIVRQVFRGMLVLPGQSLLTIISVGAGVGVLILALSLSALFSRLVDHRLSAGGAIVTFANGERNTDGQVEPARPLQFDETVLRVVPVEVPGVTALSPVTSPPWDEVRVGDRAWQVRSVLGVSEQYARIMGLETVAGTPWTAEDVAAGARKALITASLAELLYGSAEQAIGRTFQPPAMRIVLRSAGGGHRMNREPPPVQVFTVAAVVADPPEVQRRAYSVADILIPYTASFPMALDFPMARRFLLATQVVQVRGAGVATVEAQLREVLAREYGEELKLLAWEGTPRGETAWLAQTRRTVATFRLVVSLLGFVLLATGAIGILSIMLVEVLGRSREIALQRAFGASRRAVAGEFFLRSAALSLAAAAAGLAASLALAGPLERVLQPILAGVGIGRPAGGLVTLPAVALAFAAALLLGGAFGALPVLSALQTPIADGLREA